MLRRLLRQRRRLFILSICAALAAMLALGPGLTSLVALITGCAVAALIVLLAPTARSVIECLALALPIAALIPVHDIASPIAMGALTLIIHVALYGRWSDYTPLRLRLISHRTARVRTSVSEVWRKLIPGEGDVTDHWNPSLVDFATDEDDPLTLYLRHATPSGIPSEATVTFLSKIKNRRCRYIYDANIEDLPSGVPDEALYDITFVPQDGGTCLIQSVLHHAALPPRLALGRWLDDCMGDEWDSFAATISCKRDWSMTGLRRKAATRIEGV